MLDRRKFLKIGASLSALPLIPSLSAGKTVEASKVNLGLVKNGEVITAAHWGILKLTIKDGKIVKSEPWEKVTKMDNPLQHYTADM
ncbi:trimethylamine-N-oxide reductase TorA, partial [Campylobacter jejuni]|nr:trimethylamine-N-oxide reductase TorA [Campylobacter jejuni]